MQPTNPTNLLSVADVKALAPELASTLGQFDDTTISGLISQATQSVLDVCQVKGFDRQLMTDEGDAQISSEGDLVISVFQYPLQSANDVVSVSLVKGGFKAALTLSDSMGHTLFQVADPGWRFEFPNSYFYLTGTYLAGGSSQLLTLKSAHVKYIMTYYGGFTTIPQNLKSATMLMLRDILKQTINPFNATSWRQGGMSQSFSPGYRGKSTLYEQAERMLYNGGFVRVAQY